MGRVEGKTAIVTGASQGLGRAAALMLAREGARVVVSDVREVEGAQTRDAIVANGGEAIFLRHDVSSEDDWAAVMKAAAKHFGAPDVLVNNAGVLFSSKIEETPLEKWRWLMSINCDGVFLGTKHAINAMKDRGGSIVNFSSVAGLVGLPNISAYCASKGAVTLFTKAAALECAEAGYSIRVNSIHPGGICLKFVAIKKRTASGARASRRRIKFPLNAEIFVHANGAALVGLGPDHYYSAGVASGMWAARAWNERGVDRSRADEGACCKPAPFSPPPRPGVRADAGRVGACLRTGGGASGFLAGHAALHGLRGCRRWLEFVGWRRTGHIRDALGSWGGVGA